MNANIYIAKDGKIYADEEGKVLIGQIPFPKNWNGNLALFWYESEEFIELIRLDPK